MPVDGVCRRPSAGGPMPAQTGRWARWYGVQRLVDVYQGLALGYEVACDTRIGHFSQTAYRQDILNLCTVARLASVVTLFKGSSRTAACQDAISWYQISLFKSTSSPAAFISLARANCQASFGSKDTHKTPKRSDGISRSPLCSAQTLWRPRRPIK